MANLESAKLSGAYPAGGLTDGAREYSGAVETQAELPDGFSSCSRTPGLVEGDCSLFRPLGPMRIAMRTA